MKLKFPSAYTILFALIAVVAIATHYVPAGQYERVTNQELGKEHPVPDIYQVVPSGPQNLSM